MSDTTITAEERALWRKRFDSPFFDKGCKPFSLRALDALEDSERRVSELTSLLDASCEETRQNFSALYKTATEVIPALNANIEQAEARLNDCGEDLKRAAALAEQAEARAEKAEANVARLTKERDWLATQLACIQSAYDIDQKTRDWSTARWAEAARRAVAAGEEAE